MNEGRLQQADAALLQGKRGGNLARLSKHHRGMVS
jgi:hypothetical protein